MAEGGGLLNRYSVLPGSRQHPFKCRIIPCLPALFRRFRCYPESFPEGSKTPELQDSRNERVAPSDPGSTSPHTPGDFFIGGQNTASTF